MITNGLIDGTLVTPAQLGLAVLLHMLLWWQLGPWLLRQWRAAPLWQRRWLGPVLALRLLIALYTSMRPSADVIGYSSHGWIIMRQLWASPAAWLHTLGSNEFVFEDWRVVFYGMSNTFFFHKLLSVLNLLTLSVDKLNAAYLSLFSMVGGWQLQRTVARLWPAAGPGAFVALVLWPPMLLWTSTYTKESVLLGSGTWLLALVLQLLYGPPATSRAAAWGRGAGMVGLALLHFNMRYFFAAPLLGVLLGLAAVWALGQLGLRARLLQAGLILGVLGLGAWAASQVSLAFRPNKFTTQMIKVYTHHLETTAQRPHFSYPQLVPTVESAVAHLPLAVLNALTRPVLGEALGAQYVAAGLENLLLLGLLGLAAVAWWRGRSGPLPFALVLALAVYCLLLAALLGLTTPNYGTLNRYRSAMLPYLLLLLLQNDYARRTLQRLGLG